MAISIEKPELIGTFSHGEAPVQGKISDALGTISLKSEAVGERIKDANVEAEDVVRNAFIRAVGVRNYGPIVFRGGQKKK